MTSYSKDSSSKVGLFFDINIGQEKERCPDIKTKTPSIWHVCGKLMDHHEIDEKLCLLLIFTIK